MAPRTVYANLTDGLNPFSLFDQSFADAGNLGMIPCTATGTNALTLTPIPTSFAPNISAPPQQLQNFTFVAPATSTGALTVKVISTTGAASFFNLYKEDGATQASTGDLVLNVLYGIAYNSALNSSAGGYQITFPITSILNPVISGATISNSTITTSTYNGNTWTAGTGILTIAALKTLTVSNSLTFTGTDGNSFAFPAGSDTVVTLSATQALVNKTINGNTLTAGTWTLTGGSAKTLTFNNSLTLAGTDGTTMTFPGTSDIVVTLGASQALTNKTLTSPTLTSPTISGGSHTAMTGLALRDTSAAFDLTFVATSSPALTAGRTLTFNIENVSEAINLNGSLTFGSNFTTSGAFPLTLTTTASTNVTLPTTGTLATLGGVETFTNKTLTTPTINQGNLVGTTTNDNASSGVVGEYVESPIASGSAVALTSATGKTVTSISLTAGDWDVDVSAYFTATGNITTITAGLSTTTNTIDTTVGRWAQLILSLSAPPTLWCAVPPYRLSLSTTTTIYFVAQSTFSTGANSAFGLIRARRVR